MVWIGFSDDDDIWHPKRLETFYSEGIANVQAKPTSAAHAQIKFPWHTVRVHYSGPERVASLRKQAGSSSKPGPEARPLQPAHRREEHRAARSAAEVDDMLRCGGANMCHFSSSGECEHWTAISRFEVLDAFFTAAPPKLVSSPFADLAWDRFSSSRMCSDDANGRPVVAGGAESLTIEWRQELPWMYYYNAPPGVQIERRVQVQAPTDAPPGDASSSSVHMSSADWLPTPEEQAVASRVFYCMPLNQAARDNAAVEIDKLAQKLAHLRRNLSVTCAQRLWPLRWRASAPEMFLMLIKDLEKTWRVIPADQQREVVVMDYKLLDASRPLQRLLHGLELPNSDETVRLFEARCTELASFGFWVSADDQKSKEK